MVATPGWESGTDRRVFSLNLYDTSCDIVKKFIMFYRHAHAHWYHITTYGRAFVLHGSRSPPRTAVTHAVACGHARR